MKQYIYLLILLPYLLFAHPHTFIDVLTDVKSNKNKVETITFKWRFDEMTSQLLIMEFDQNLNGKIDKEENDFIKTNYFDSLNEFNFYTNLSTKEKIQVTKPNNFSASIENGINLIYKFDIKIDKDKKDFKIELYDEDMFTALVLKDEFITSDLKFKVSDVDNDIYFGYRLEF